MIIVPALIYLSQPVTVFSREEPPVCEKVLVEENSTAGPNYYVKLCGDRRLPIHEIIVDGSKLPERTETGTRPHNVLFWYRQ